MEENAIKNALNFSLTSWLKDKKTQKYAVALLIISAISFVMAMSVIGTVFSSLGNLVTAGSEPSQQQAITFLSSLIGAIAVISVVSFVMSFIEMAILYMVSARALEVKKFKPIKIDFGNYVMLIVLGIVQIIAALISLMNLKLLWILVAGIVGLFIGVILLIFSPVIGVILTIVSALLMIAYMFVIIYNSVRLAFCGVAYIEQERGIMESLQESWNRTEGNFWEVVVAMIVFFVIMMIIIYVAGIPSMIYSQMYVLSIGISDTEGTAAFTAMSGMFKDPIYLALSVFTLLAGAWASIANTFFMVSIYDSLKPRKATVAKAKAKPAPKKKAKKPKKQKK